MSREPGRYLRSGSADRMLRVALYCVVVSAPLVFAWLQQPTTDHPRLQEAAKAMALCGYAILAMQPILAARYRWIERPFGLDAVFAFHRRMGILAGVLLLSHPVVYAAGGEWSLLWEFDHGWPIALGKLAFVLLGVLVVTSVFRKALRLDFERWRGMHDGLAAGVLVLGFVHGVAAGGDFTGWPARMVWFGLFGFSFGSYLVHLRTVLPKAREAEFTVSGLSEAAEGVWNLELRPSRPEYGLDHLPGQFAFVTVHRDGAPVEEHPFSIASAPQASGALTMTIKESGDYTRTIGGTQRGDRATIRGPYGRFSHLLHGAERPLVFVAGGVGVTPFLSMLRAMRDRGTGRPVVLIYGNRRETDIVAREELEAMEASGVPRLQVVHVLSRAGDSWSGERGRVTASLIERRCGALQGRDFYVSGPPSMITSVVSGLRDAAVPPGCIHIERFEL